MEQIPLLSIDPSSKSKPFEFQNWPVYKEAVLFSKTASQICSQLPPDGRRGLSDQLTRASQSVALNLAEGCARTTPKDKANFFRIAKGSLFECVAVLDLLAESGLLPVERSTEIQIGLANTGKMISGLIRYIEKNQG